jgi:hypothetical protein
MSSKKVANILSLIEIAESNLKAAKSLLSQLSEEKLGTKSSSESRPSGPVNLSSDEEKALDTQLGYFDGENMIGDNGKIYPVPQNYASKTQLVVGDRMKWILTPEREAFKLIQPAPRERVIGTFTIEGDNFLVLVDKLSSPVKILKASATFAMKNLGLQIGDEVAIIIPKDVTPTWGAFSSVIKSGETEAKATQPVEAKETPKANVDELNEFKLAPDDTSDYF